MQLQKPIFASLRCLDNSNSNTDRIGALAHTQKDTHTMMPIKTERAAATTTTSAASRRARATTTMRPIKTEPSTRTTAAATSTTGGRARPAPTTSNQSSQWTTFSDHARAREAYSRSAAQVQTHLNEVMGFLNRTRAERATEINNNRAYCESDDDNDAEYCESDDEYNAYDESVDEDEDERFDQLMAYHDRKVEEAIMDEYRRNPHFQLAMQLRQPQQHGSSQDQLPRVDVASANFATMQQQFSSMQQRFCTMQQQFSQMQELHAVLQEHADASTRQTPQQRIQSDRNLQRLASTQSEQFGLLQQQFSAMQSLYAQLQQQQAVEFP